MGLMPSFMVKTLNIRGWLAEQGFFKIFQPGVRVPGLDDGGGLEISLVIRGL